MIVRDRHFRGFGADSFVFDLAARRAAGESIRLNPDDAVVAKIMVENIRIAANPEEIGAEDPRHPQHALWLKAQKKKSAQKKFKSVAKVGGLVGGGLLVLFLGLAFLKKRKKAKAATP